MSYIENAVRNLLTDSEQEKYKLALDKLSVEECYVEFSEKGVGSFDLFGAFDDLYKFVDYEDDYITFIVYGNYENDEMGCYCLPFEFRLTIDKSGWIAEEWGVDDAHDMEDRDYDY